jgi:hypothetical protein
MDAGKVAGLLVLLGVVGVLAAIVGSGLEAGPVKFPSIPSSRQKLLAGASIAVVAGGVGWWIVQQGQKEKPARSTTSVAKSSVAPGTLRIVLLPASSDVHVGDTLSVSSTVIDSDGEIGTDQCVLTWRDEVQSKLVRSDTTKCDATFTEPSVSKPGVHRITVTGEGQHGSSGTGTRSIDVNVSR